MANLRILFFVQHLRGIGHLKRATVLARALVAAGFEVDLVSGGMPVPGLDVGAAKLTQLPPVQSPDDEFSRLTDAAGAPIGPQDHEVRKKQLLEIYHRSTVHGLIVETFPFGRSQIRCEILALLGAARQSRPRPCIISSVRDIVATKRSTQRYEDMADDVDAWFDHVLVHGDPDFLPFDASFPAAPRLEGKLHYTGYVVDAGPLGDATGKAALAPCGAEPGAGEVVVSAGGGAFGIELLRCALAARKLSRLKDAPWRLITGPNLPETDFHALKRDAGPGVIIERMRNDFRDLIGRAAVSVSQAGYNTVMDIFNCGAHAVLVPYLTGRQTEQSQRAACLAGRGDVKVVTQEDLTPERLATAIDAASAGPPASAAGIDLDGAATTARLVGTWLGTHP